MMKKIIDKISAHLRQRMHDQVIAAAPWYVGDPCYIIPDDQWDDFCDTIHKNDFIEWHGQEIEILSCGGDGTWGFTGLRSANGKTSFGVDAGIFCVINLNALPSHKAEINDGILFETKPDLYVEDDIVYLNGLHDDHHMTCDNWRCGLTIGPQEYLSCGNGCCEGCDWCGVGWECEEE
jgi:hypothetical protein